jgi:hypothetical protein
MMRAGQTLSRPLRLAGTEKLLSFGVWPDVNLEEARRPFVFSLALTTVSVSWPCRGYLSPGCNGESDGADRVPTPKGGHIGGILSNFGKAGSRWSQACPRTA